MTVSNATLSEGCSKNRRVAESSPKNKKSRPLNPIHLTSVRVFMLVIRLPVAEWVSQHVRLRGTIWSAKHEPISSPQVSVAAVAAIFSFPGPFLYDNVNLIVR